MSPISSLRTRITPFSDDSPTQKPPAPPFTPLARKSGKETPSPVRYVPSSQSQYLYLSPLRPRLSAPSRAGEDTDEIVESSQSQPELCIAKYDSLLLSETVLGVDVSSAQR
jgi:hypothetical protein